MAERDTIISPDLKPTYVAQPNERFATTFLSIQNRDYAVKGESLMDKATGEIFAKRTADERVVSFYQNKKYMYELMLKLKILTTNNPAFVFNETDKEGSYINTDYDLISTQIEDISKVDIASVNEINFLTSGNPLQQVCFTVAPDSNGFFLRLTSRDTDKAVINWVTGRYINHLQNDFTVENYNAVVTYTIDAYNGTSVSTTITATGHVRINEESLIMFPSTIPTGDNVTKYVVHILKVDFTRYRTAETYCNNDGHDRVAYADDHLYIYYMNIGYFTTDLTNNLTLLGNEFIVAMLDTVSTTEYMEKVTKLAVNAAMIRGINRPTNRVWTKNNLWAEEISRVSNDGQTITYNETEVDIKGLESFLANNVVSTRTQRVLRSIEAGGIPDTDYVRIGTDDESIYTREEMDEILNSFRSNMTEMADGLVDTNASNVSDKGLFIQTLSEDGDRE